MHDDDLDLTADEREALRALPRERDPGELLEERTVRALRARGLIRSSGPPRFAISPAWASAAAAAVALFLGGFAFGQWVESRQTREAFIAMHRQDAAEAAASVQRAGSAYISALATLANAVQSGAGSKDVAQGREVALNTLHAAANQMVRIAPEEPVATRILQGLERARGADSSKVAAAEPQRLIWF